MLTVNTRVKDWPLSIRFLRMLSNAKPQVGLTDILRDTYDVICFSTLKG